VTRASLLLLALLVTSLLAGCGSSRDRGKNMDYDRPKPTTAK
jgi:hypothetical protein